jgi:hypothetical protein
VAARWTKGGWLDLALVDAATGAVALLTEDRAKDVEPAWTADGASVVFRSDRDGVSNLYALRLADRALLRVTNVLGGAFTPDVAPGGGRLAFASYGARGYDIHVADVDLGSAPVADPFSDPYPAPRPDPPPAGGPDRPYRPGTELLPRFWSPYVASIAGETRIGAATAGADPLFRHAYGVEVHRGTETDRFGVQGFYQYDRFRPTLLAFFEDTTEPEADDRLRTRRVLLQASLPVRRRIRSSQSLSLAWRRERQWMLGSDEEPFDLGGLEAAWSMSTVKRHPYSISAVDGHRLRAAVLKEDPAFGGAVSLFKLTLDGRAYLRLSGHQVLALRVGGGATLGRSVFRRSFAVGGFPDGTLFDVVRTNHAVLRGYPDGAFTGRAFSVANVEYRFPFGHPQRGFRTLPFFLRHVHGAVFADAAHAWSGRFRMSDVKTGVGAALGIDFNVGHALPVTATVGLARGLAASGETRVYFRAGLSF